MSELGDLIIGTQRWMAGDVIPDRLRLLGSDDINELRDELITGRGAIELLRYALHLRMSGERAPGGTETWREFDQRTETLLRAIDGQEAP
jgi:hypothetical protein